MGAVAALLLITAAIAVEIIYSLKTLKYAREKNEMAAWWAHAAAFAVILALAGVVAVSLFFILLQGGAS